MQNHEFQERVKSEGQKHLRSMPWRDDTRPYYVVVSEMMLQQTQVSRVIPKFKTFIETFPSFDSLALAPLAEVLVQWQGLGYNRRAKYLHDLSKMVINTYGGVFPADEAEMIKLPGIGRNTAGAIAAYCFNQPSIFVETNVRTVYIHHFFADDFKVDDKRIRQKIEDTIDREHAREFYWALMDYGSWLKTNGVKSSRRSKLYKKQSPLEGSLRQMRGKIVLELTRAGEMQESKLRETLQNDERFPLAVLGLIHDGLVMRKDQYLHLTK